jgi:hypothetical protein
MESRSGSPRLGPGCPALREEALEALGRFGRGALEGGLERQRPDPLLGQKETRLLEQEQLRLGDRVGRALEQGVDDRRRGVVEAAVGADLVDQGCASRGVKRSPVSA